MKHACILVLTLVLTCLTAVATARPVIDERQSSNLLFVLSASSGTLRGDTLTLRGVPAVVYFSDRPARLAGHVTLEKFVTIWNTGADSFKADPPNGSLSGLSDNNPTTMVLELKSPALDGDVISFTVRPLQGCEAGDFGPASLFIDAFPTAVNSQITD